MRKVAGKDQTHFAVFFVEVEFPLEVGEVMVMMVIHHWIRIEDELEVDSGSGKRYLGVTLAASISEAQLSFFLRSVAEPSVADLEIRFVSQLD